MKGARNVVEKRQRRERSDVGAVRQTARDAQLLEFAAQMYGLPLDLLAQAAGVSKPRAYALVSRWKKAGWIDRGAVDAGPTWVWPTKAIATQYLGWDAPYWRPVASQTRHIRATAALRLHQVGLDLSRWVSERDLRHRHQGWRTRGKSEEHMPDGVEVLADGRRALIEVELTPKNAARYLEPGMQTVSATGGLLQRISNRARDLDCELVAYWCAPEALPVVQRQVQEYQERVRTAQRGKPDSTEWHVRSLEEVPGWTVQP